jgi:hypothetical protein
MPYHYPVAMAISVIWWGIYIGCLGASLGALFALFTGGAAMTTRGGAPSADCATKGESGAFTAS